MDRISRRPTPPFERLSSNQSTAAATIKEQLKQGWTHRFVTKELTEIIGRQPVRTRWDNAPKIGISRQVRELIDWEGSANQVAERAVARVANYGYPSSVELTDFLVRKAGHVGRHIGDKQVEKEIETALKKIYGE